MRSLRRPKFSVVIPTTRPHLLRFALESVLAQTMRDLEVVISYNVPPEAPDLDWLPADPRIRYLRPDRQLTQFQNWDFACQHATGEWMGLLGDDDVLVPQALEIALIEAARHPQISIMSWRWASFFSDDWPEAHLRGLAGAPPFSGGVEILNCAEFLRDLYSMRVDRFGHIKRYLPSIMRGAYRWDIRRAMLDRVGNICMPWTPDYSAAALALTYAEVMLAIDLPLVVLGATVDCMAAIYSGRPEVYESNFVASGKPRYEYTLVQAKVHSRPLIAETLMKTRDRAPDRLGQFEFDRVAFLEWHYDGLLERAQAGAAVGPAFDEFHQALAGLPDAQVAELRPRMAALEQKHRANPRLAARRLDLTRFVSERMVSVPPLRGLLARQFARKGGQLRWPNCGIESIVDFSNLLGGMIAQRRTAIAA